MAEKRCGHCLQDLPIEAFAERAPRGSRHRDGRHYWCQECVRAKGREYYAANSTKPREYHFRKKYGIGIAERDELIRAQQGKCAICGGDQAGSNWATLAVDHDHETGQIRGMLCSHCNRGLGHFRDDTDLLLAAAAYLIQYSDVLGQLSTLGLEVQ